MTSTSTGFQSDVPAALVFKPCLFTSQMDAIFLWPVQDDLEIMWEKWRTAPMTQDLEMLEPPPFLPAWLKCQSMAVSINIGTNANAAGLTR